MGRRNQRNVSAAAPADTVSDRDAQGPAGLSATSGLSVVKLTEERLNAKGKSCAVGTVIGPNVEGWPEHRVNWHLQHGFALPVTIEASDEPPAVAVDASGEEAQLAMEAPAQTESSDLASAAADELERE